LRALSARHGSILASLLWLAGCSATTHGPWNQPLTASPAPAVEMRTTALHAPPGGTGIVMAFSGGGARSAAFGYGALGALTEFASPGGRGRTLADDVVTVSGVSGGAILASYFALNGPAGLESFRQRFLDQDVEAALRTTPTPDNLWRAYQGGINDHSGLPSWLDANLFHGATFASLGRPGRPRLVVHATDLYSRSPFIFDRASFSALCSDIDSYPLSQAVAASAAVPILFSPIVLRNFNGSCGLRPPARHRLALPARSADPSLTERDYQAALGRYRTEPDLNFVKLYDGGLVDGLGTQSLVHLMRRDTPEPLSPDQAARLDRVVFIVVDASTRIGGDMSMGPDGPNAIDVVVGATDAMIDSASRHSVDLLRRQAGAWRDQVVAWRCARPERRADCRNFEVTVIRIALADVTDRTLRRRILGLHNKLTLKPEDVRLVADLGRRMLIGDAAFAGALAASGARRSALAARR
jgi:NTE family protein